MNQSSDEDTSGVRDRGRRSNPRVAQTRQTLGAVGRVASRVRHSGVLTKANSLLQRQKEEEQAAVNESPWGVATPAVTKVGKNVSQESRPSSEKSNPALSPRAGRRSDMVSLSSPLSLEQVSPSRLPETNSQSHAKDEDSSLRERRSGQIGSDRTGGERKVEKRTERTSPVLPSLGTSRGLAKSVSRFGFRSNDRKSKSQGPVIDFVKARSAMSIPLKDTKKDKSSRQEKEKETSEVIEDTGRRRASVHENELSTLDAEAMHDTKMWGFHLSGLGRSRTKHDDLAPKVPRNRARSSERVKMERARTKSGVARSISNAMIMSPKATSSGKESPMNGPDSEKSEEGKKTRNRKSFKDTEQRQRRGRSSWLKFSGDSGDSQTRGMMAQSRSKSKTRRERSSGGQETEAEMGKRISGKASKDLAEMEDFAIDEYFDSEEDEVETASAPRSMVDDDFITYQTGKGKKAQGNRSRIRMRPPS